MRILGGAAVAIALAACGGAAEDVAPDATIEVPALRGAPGAIRGSFELTYYWMSAEADFTAPADTAIYDEHGAVLDRVPAKFASALELEGTGRLHDGRTINRADACAGRRVCYHAVDAAHPWGEGVQDRALVPFRTIAVDRTQIAYGTKLYVAELDGVLMPGDPPWGGFVHDGCVVAGDTGARITGAHVDLFAAVKSGYVELDGRLGLRRVTLRDAGARCPS
ncbi:MAG TPA: 3D domain-containing protein [Kofleriaceae bacterium]|nr:3D domain-containing protein [Kofleriaceae bacterium]